VALAVVTIATAIAGSSYQGFAATAKSAFSLSAKPSSITVNSGGTGNSTVTMTPLNGFTGNVTLAVTSSLPAGVTVTFSRNPVSPNTTACSTCQSSTMAVTAGTTTAAGSYTLTISGTSGTAPSSTTTLGLTVPTTSTAGFTIRGTAQGLLAPGVTQPVNLSLTNPSSSDLDITNLTIAVGGITASAGAVGGCTASDFAVRQFAGQYPIRLLSSRTVTLNDLGIPPSSWPQLTMINRPVDQDGCKGATVNLTFSGSAGKPTT
jgi:hypothetical protein